MHTTAEDMKRIALRLLERSGPDAVSMRQVAKATGVTPMAIYHHFRNRAALLEAVVAEEFAKLEAEWGNVKLVGGFEEKMAQVLLGYVQYALDRPRLFDYLFAEKRAGARQYPADFRARLSPTLTRIADLVRSAIGSGELASGDEWEIAMTLWAHVHGFVMLHRAGRFALSDTQYRALVKRSLGHLLRGLA